MAISRLFQPAIVFTGDIKCKKYPVFYYCLPTPVGTRKKIFQSCVASFNSRVDIWIDVSTEFGLAVFFCVQTFYLQMVGRKFYFKKKLHKFLKC